MVTQVAHGLLNALRQRLAGPLDDDLQRHTEHIPVFVLAPLDPLYELGHSPKMGRNGTEIVRSVR